MSVIRLFIFFNMECEHSISFNYYYRKYLYLFNLKANLHHLLLHSCLKCKFYYKLIISVGIIKSSISLTLCIIEYSNTL